MAVSISKLASLKASFEKNKKLAKVGALQVILVGCSGSGKSSATGTLPGNTLYLTTTAERHGAEACETNAKRSESKANVTSICFDVDDEGSSLSPDKSLELLFEVLKPEDIKDAGFNNVVIDSLSTIEALIRKTSYLDNFCMSAKGVKNDFKVNEGIIAKINDIVVVLNRLNTLGIHTVVTCAANIKSLNEDGSASEVTPILTGFGIVNAVLQMFPDIILQSRIQIINDEGVLETKFGFVFDGNLSKESKDIRGSVTKFANFAPRLTGALTLPSKMRSDFRLLLELKKDSK